MAMVTAAAAGEEMTSSAYQ